MTPARRGPYARKTLMKGQARIFKLICEGSYRSSYELAASVDPTRKSRFRQVFEQVGELVRYGLVKRSPSGALTGFPARMNGKPFYVPPGHKSWSEMTMPAVVRPEDDPRVAQFVPLVWHVARRFEKSLAAVCSVDDLVSLGMEALWKACSTYREDGGASFKTYAYNGVMHAMIGEYQKWCKPKRAPARFALSVEGDDDTPPVQVAETRIPADLALQAKADASAVRESLESLPPRLRRLVEARFFEDRTLEEVGNEFGFSRERARQLETRALRLLGKQLQPRLRAAG